MLSYDWSCGNLVPMNQCGLPTQYSMLLQNIGQEPVHLTKVVVLGEVVPYSCSDINSPLVPPLTVPAGQTQQICLPIGEELYVGATYTIAVYVDSPCNTVFSYGAVYGTNSENGNGNTQFLLQGFSWAFGDNNPVLTFANYGTAPITVTQVVWDGTQAAQIIPEGVARSPETSIFLTTNPGQTLSLDMITSAAYAGSAEPHTVSLLTVSGSPLEYAVVSEANQGVAAFGHCSSAAVTSSFDDLGEWINVDPNTQSITRIVIVKNDSSLTVHVWGKCEPTDCDWGAVSVPYQGQPFVAVYTFTFAVKTLTMTLQGQTLHVHTLTHFTDNSGRQDYTTDDYFAPE